MFFIWGFGKKTVKQMGQDLPVNCDRCHNEVRYTLAIVKTWFTLFFIPLIPYSTERVAVCPICGVSYVLTKESFEERVAANGLPQSA